MTTFQIGDHLVGSKHPAYFIADISANHDGSLDRALHLMTLAKEAGADCAKFQHFRAAQLVSDYGFRALGLQQSHQAAWDKSVFEVYSDASLPWSWTQELANHGKEIGIEFMSTPYDRAAIEHLDPYVNAFKIGSGDINWTDGIKAIAARGKPVLLATGAATLQDVQRAMGVLLGADLDIVLMQCNTNYTGFGENLHYINVRVLNEYARLYPDVTLGLSDHTPGHVTVLAAITLGARVIEKHFTDDTSRVGPDHLFSLEPRAWREMVEAARVLETALGTGAKGIEENELETVVLQRRCVRAARDIPAGSVVNRDDLVVLRPAPAEAIPAHDVEMVVGKTLSRNLVAGQEFRLTDLA